MRIFSSLRIAFQRQNLKRVGILALTSEDFKKNRKVTYLNHWNAQQQVVSWESWSAQNQKVRKPSQMLLTSTQQRFQFYCKGEMYCLAILPLISSRGNQFQAQQGQSPSHPLSRSIQSANQGDTWSFKGRTCPPVIQWPLPWQSLGEHPHWFSPSAFRYLHLRWSSLHFLAGFPRMQDHPSWKITSTEERGTIHSLFCFQNSPLKRTP